MKFIRKLCLLLILCCLFIPSVKATSEKNLVNIYLFYSNSCPHCSMEKKLLSEIELKYDNVRIYKYEIGDDANLQLLKDIANMYDTEVTGVPFTVIADKVYKGFSYDESKGKFLGTIEYYSDHGYKDLVGEYIGNTELPSYEIGDTSDFKEFINNYGSHTISFLGFKINTKNLTLPLISVLIGLVDGFNPCAMWVLLFLISMLIGMKN